MFALHMPSERLNPFSPHLPNLISSSSSKEKFSGHNREIISVGHRKSLIIGQSQQ